MKIKHLLIATLALSAAFSCQREQNVTEEPDNNWDSKYMGFSISAPVTKADPAPGTYKEGEAYENQINTIHFFFYHDGAYVSWGYGDMSDAFQGGSSSETGVEKEYNDGTGAKEGVVVLESTMTQPNQVLCVVNSRDYTFYKNKPLSEIMNALHTGASGVTHNDTDTFKDFFYTVTEGAQTEPYFVMFTSPMYGRNKEDKYEIKNVTDIDPAIHIRATRAEAKAHPVDIYVERIAAQMEINNWAALTAGTDGTIPESFFDAAMMDGSDPKWDIKPVAWGVTAMNTNSYDLKHVDLAWFSQQSSGQPFYGWLQSGNTVPNPLVSGETMSTRINWCYDLNYNDPEASDRVAYPHSARELHANNVLKYWSAADIQTHHNAGLADKKSEAGFMQRYAYENSLNEVGQKDPRVTGTLLLMTAQLKNHGAAAYEDLYGYMGNYLTYDEYVAQACAVALAGGVDLKVKDGSTYRNIKADELKITKASKIEDVYTQNAASYTTSSSVWNGESAAYPGQEVKDVWDGYLVDLEKNLVIPDANLPELNYVPTDKVMKAYSDGYVTLVPDFSNIPEGKLFVEDTDTATNPAYDPADPTTAFREATQLELVKVFLHDVVSAANHYKDGLMYYAIPLEHFGSFDANGAAMIGKYGVVRNNCYSVEVGKIKTVGHGIHDETEPIVPGDRKDPFYVAAKVNVLSWQMVNQTANLEE